MRSFENQIAVVTGASGGIGGAIATGLAAEGAVVCLVGRRVSTLEAIRKEAQKTSDRLIAYEVDLQNDGEVRRFALNLSQSYNGIDILVHSAGIISIGRIDTYSVEEFDQQYRVNVRAPYLLTQVLLPMIISRRGQIVFINSSAGLNAKAGVAGYSASKHALKALADVLRAEVNTAGVRVINIYPGRTATPMQARLFEVEGRSYVPEMLLQPEDISQAVIEALRISRSAEITDLSIRSAQKWD